jgi:thiamine pyrophosphokinase
VTLNSLFPTISFIPITKEVFGLTLEGFYYPLKGAKIKMGSTLSISNKLIRNNGTFSFEDGIVLVVRSRD